MASFQFHFYILAFRAPSKIGKIFWHCDWFLQLATLLACQSVTIFLTIQWLLRRAYIRSFDSLQMILHASLKMQQRYDKTFTLRFASAFVLIDDGA